MARDRTLPQDPDSPVRTYRVQPAPERIVHYPGMAQLAQRETFAAVAGQRTVTTLILWCEEAERKWPLIGWREAAEALRRRPPHKQGLATLGQLARGRRPAVQPWDRVSSQQRSQEELERQKAEILGLDGQAVSESVPF